MSPHKGYMNIAIAAMLFVAAFAGVAFIADEDFAAAESGGSQAQGSEGTLTNQEGGEEDNTGSTGTEDDAPVTVPKVKTITYCIKDGDSATRTVGDADTFVAPTLADVGLKSNFDFKYWYAPDGAKFNAGQEYLVSALGNADATGNVKLVAELDTAVYITFNVGEQSFKCIVKDGALDVTNEAYKGLEASVKAIDQTKFEIGKLMNGEVEAGSIDIAEDGAVTVSVTSLTASAVLTLELTPIYNVDFIVDGTVIAKCASNKFAYKDAEGAVKTLQPIDPVKANYTFMGWAVDGKIVSEVKAGVITIPADYKFEADTAFTAVFEPVQLTLTLVVGEFQTTQPALYGQKITAPGLPDGYSHWATMAIVDEKEVYTEFDFSQEIVESMTLYAQKAEKVYTISFISEGAVIGGPYDVSKPYTIPADPVVEGKKFVGWFVGDYKVADIKAYVAEHPDEDIVLTASFTQADAPAGPGFFETNEGKCVAVIIGVALFAFVYAVYTNMFGMKDFLTSIKIQRVKKE